MTPEEATALIVGRLVPRYMRQAELISAADGYAKLTQEERSALNQKFANNDLLGGARILQSGRKVKATELATIRGAAIIANGSIDIDGELDEIT